VGTWRPVRPVSASQPGEWGTSTPRSIAEHLCVAWDLRLLRRKTGRDLPSCTIPAQLLEPWFGYGPPSRDPGPPITRVCLALGT
jgi:hypothetical protein